MNDVSGLGLRINVKASVTFPAGFVLSQFPDDSDPFDLPSVQLADKAMGMNGDLITWSKASPLLVNLSVIPASDDDINLSVLAEANRVGKGKRSARDTITITAVYPNGKTITLTNGKLTDAPIGSGYSSAGRLKTKTYAFCFENAVVTNG